MNGEYNDAVEMALVYSKRPDAPNSFALGMAYTNNVGIGEALGVVTGSNDTRVDGSPVKLTSAKVGVCHQFDDTDATLPPESQSAHSFQVGVHMERRAK